MTVLSAQVTQACCPYEDPNCGVPTTCDPKCAPVFENFWTSCQSFIDVRASAVFVTPLPLSSNSRLVRTRGRSSKPSTPSAKPLADTVAGAVGETEPSCFQKVRSASKFHLCEW